MSTSSLLENAAILGLSGALFTYNLIRSKVTSRLSGVLNSLVWPITLPTFLLLGTVPFRGQVRRTTHTDELPGMVEDE